MKKFITTSVLVLFSLLCFGARGIKTVIITGQNNHNWPVSSEAIRLILNNSGLFDAQIAQSPSQGGDMNSFFVDFSKYKLVVLDYNGDEWSSPMKEAFLDYVRKGGALVIYHAADNAFANWKEFNEIIVLGGWEGRNEKSGPYIYLQDGKMVRDNTPGPGGNHGLQHEYLMNSQCSHPVLEGLPEHWMHAQDELYEKMRGPGNIKDLMYTAFADAKYLGSHREEPLVFSVDYGKARIFHIMIGHAGPTLQDNPAMQCTGFQVLLLRGCEWAAKGRVSQKVPADFPSASQTSFRPDYR